MSGVVAAPQKPLLFSREENHQDFSARRIGSQAAGDFEDRAYPRGIVVGPAVNLPILVDAEMIVVRTQDDVVGTAHRADTPHQIDGNRGVRSHELLTVSRVVDRLETQLLHAAFEVLRGQRQALAPQLAAHETIRAELAQVLVDGGKPLLLRLAPPRARHEAEREQNEAESESPRPARWTEARCCGYQRVRIILPP